MSETFRPLALGIGAALTVASLILGVLPLFLGRMSRPERARTAVPAGLAAGPSKRPPAARGIAAAIAFRRARREAEGGLDDVLVEVAEHLRAGYSLVQALRQAAEGGVKPPWPHLLKEVLERYEQGVTLPEALSTLERMGGQSVNLAVQAIRFHYRSGGNLGEVLLRLADDLREARLLRGEVEARTAEARWTAFIVAVIPFVLATYFGMSNPGWVAPLLDDPAGRLGAAYAAVSWLTGVLLVHRLLRLS